MCTLAAAIGLTAVSTAFSAMGQIQAGKAQQAQLNYQAAVDRNNAKIAEWQAVDAEKRGAEEERKRRVLTQQQIGTQRTSFAANGIDLGSDTVADVTADTAMIGELDALTIRNNYARDAWGYRVQGMNYQASAGLNTLAGKNAAKAGRTNAMGTILGGTTTIATMGYNARNPGATI